MGWSWWQVVKSGELSVAVEGEELVEYYEMWFSFVAQNKDKMVVWEIGG
jgi:hypothetical protein